MGKILKTWMAAGCLGLALASSGAAQDPAPGLWAAYNDIFARPNTST
jgi:hypothetical protein